MEFQHEQQYSGTSNGDSEFTQPKLAAKYKFAGSALLFVFGMYVLYGMLGAIKTIAIMVAKGVVTISVGLAVVGSIYAAMSIIAESIGKKDDTVV